MALYRRFERTPDFNFIDVYGILAESQRTFPIFYRQDFHWTDLAAMKVAATFLVWVLGHGALVALERAGVLCLAGDKLYYRLRGMSFHRPRLEGAYSVVRYVLSCLSVVEGGFNPFIYFQF